MSDDIIERAEAFLVDRESDMIHADRIVRELLAALKAARAENDFVLCDHECLGPHYHRSGDD